MESSKGEQLLTGKLSCFAFAAFSSQDFWEPLRVVLLPLCALLVMLTSRQRAQKQPLADRLHWPKLQPDKPAQNSTLDLCASEAAKQLSCSSFQLSSANSALLARSVRVAHAMLGQRATQISFNATLTD